VNSLLPPDGPESVKWSLTAFGAGSTELLLLPKVFDLEAGVYFQLQLGQRMPEPNIKRKVRKF